MMSRYKDRGDLIFRFVFLPDDPDERAKRIIEISKAGTDRTDPHYPKERLVLDRYTGTAEWAGVNPIDLIDCLKSSEFYSFLGDGREEDGPQPLSYFLSKQVSSEPKDQALLVFDGKTEDGVKLVRKPEYIFRNPQHKNKALLGVITVKTD